MRTSYDQGDRRLGRFGSRPWRPAACGARPDRRAQPAGHRPARAAAGLHAFTLVELLVEGYCTVYLDGHTLFLEDPDRTVADAMTSNMAFAELEGHWWNFFHQTR